MSTITLIAIDFGIQWLGSVYSTLACTEKIYDLTGSVTFLTLTFYLLLNFASFSLYNWRQLLLSSLVLCWCCRLGWFLFKRVQKHEDKRFTKAKKSAVVMFVFWNLQGLWVLITLAPLICLFHSPVKATFGLLDFVGICIWLAGYSFEVIADSQKKEFREKKEKGENGKPFIDQGLWSISRHPNYFGEISLWFGMWLCCCSCFSITQAFLTALSPMFIAFLITQVSGVPLLEKSADEKWASRADYQRYKRDTAVLIPFLY